MIEEVFTADHAAEFGVYLAKRRWTEAADKKDGLYKPSSVRLYLDSLRRFAKKVDSVLANQVPIPPLWPARRY